MPTYEYQCTKEDCSHNWEQEAPITQPPETVCPACGQPTAKRLIAGSNFSLVGQGWCRDGYK